MIENAPCMGCTNRYPACHGSCDAYKAWRDQYHAQQEHLKEVKYRFSIPPSEFRDKVRWGKHEQ